MVSEGNKKRKRNKNKKKPNQIDSEHTEEEQQIVQEEVDPEEHEDTQERNYSDVDSDTEGKPKKKKKKKPATDPAEPGKKGKKSIRQMKREKHAQRQAEAQAAAKDNLKSQCLSYLSQWKHDKQNWKFMKAKQVWLFKNKFSATLLPDASWPVLLEYFESAKGNIRKMLLDDASKVIKKMDDWLETQGGKEKNDDSDEETESDKPDDTSYKRARDLIQALEE